MAQVTDAPTVQMTTSRSQRYGGIAGIVFGLLLAVDLFLPYVSTGESIEEIRGFFVDNGDFIMATGWIEAILFVFVFLYFAACLRDTLAWSESVPSVFPRLSFTGAVLTTILGAMGSWIWITLAFNGAAVEDATLQFLAEMDTITYGFMILFTFALMAVAAGAVILKTGVLTRWLGWLGFASSLLMVVGAFWIFTGDDSGFLATLAFVGVLAWVVWVLGISYDMIRRTGTKFIESG